MVQLSIPIREYRGKDSREYAKTIEGAAFKAKQDYLRLDKRSSEDFDPLLLEGEIQGRKSVGLMIGHLFDNLGTRLQEQIRHAYDDFMTYNRHLISTLEQARDLNVEGEVKQKSHKIRRLERRFQKGADFFFNVFQDIQGGWLKEKDYEELSGIYDFFDTHFKRMDKLREGYSKLIGTAENHPDFSKYEVFAAQSFDRLQAEMALRQRGELK